MRWNKWHTAERIALNTAPLIIHAGVEAVALAATHKPYLSPDVAGSANQPVYEWFLGVQVVPERRIFLRRSRREKEKPFPEMVAILHSMMDEKVRRGPVARRKSLIKLSTTETNK